jgi:hypothetical protein
MDPSRMLVRARRTRHRHAAARGLLVALLFALVAGACTSTASSPSASESESAAVSASASMIESPSSSAEETATPTPTQPPTPTPAPTAPPTSAPTPTHPPAPGVVSDTTTFGVQSTWSQTSIQVQKDDVLTFVATGPYRGGTGQPTLSPIVINCGLPPWNFPTFPAPNLERYAVIGRIGSGGEPFCIGGGRAIKVQTSGILQVGVNTDDPAGAMGTVTVVTKRYRWSGPQPETEIDFLGGNIGGWMATSSFPVPGDYLLFHAIGRYAAGASQPGASPESVGCGGIFPIATGFLVPTQKPYALIGKQGTGGAPFCMGGSLTRYADGTGRIYVAVNDSLVNPPGTPGWIEVSTVRYHWP